MVGEFFRGTHPVVIKIMLCYNTDSLIGCEHIPESVGGEDDESIAGMIESMADNLWCGREIGRTCIKSRSYRITWW